MNTKFDFENVDPKIVYVKAIDASELPEDVHAELTTAGPLYAVHSQDGIQLAVVAGRELAFVLARQNDLSPVTVH